MNFESLPKEESPDTPEAFGDNEGGVGAAAEVEPEFVPEKVDVVRLRSAIELAIEGERPVERYRREKALAESATGVSELRNSIAREEKEGDEEKALRLEAELAKAEKGESRDQQEEVEETTGGAASTPEDIRPFREREGWVAMPTTDESARLELPQFLKDRLRQKEIAGRRTNLAEEKDPLGLARVAVEEEMAELGKKEADFLKAGPFEQISNTDKLDALREYKEFVRANPQAALESRETQLKGILYKKLEAEKVTAGGTQAEYASESRVETEESLEKVSIEYNVSLERVPIESLKEGDIINVSTQNGLLYSFRFFYMDTDQVGTGDERRSPWVECISGEKLKGGVGKIIGGIEKGKPLAFGTLNTSLLKEIVVSQKPLETEKEAQEDPHRQVEAEESIDERLEAEQARFTREEAIRKELGKERGAGFEEEDQEAA